MQIFTCGACRHTFTYPQLPLRCPDCGKQRVRIAAAREIKDYYRIRAEIAAEDEFAAEDKLLCAANQ